MITLILTLIAGSVIARAIWTKKYAQAFLLLTPLFGVYSCIAGLWIMNRDVWPGVLLIALGLGTLVYVDKNRGKV